MSEYASDKVKDSIIEEICGFVEDYAQGMNRAIKWGTPLVGFADAVHPSILALKEIISPFHAMPSDVLPGAAIVIASFIPFSRELAQANSTAGRLASPEWALAYEQTNKMFIYLNLHLIGYLEGLGYRAADPREAHTFDQEALISNWSHRHLAYAAGLGTFGLNNMLITKSGCCGRYTTLVTNLDVKPDHPIDDELCLFRKNGSCGICVQKCPMGALSTSGYDRKNCYSLLKENARVYTEYGSSYIEAESGKANSEGSEVCGKCITESPCAFWQIK
jgi:epoxyqueuosine reductase QueG